MRRVYELRKEINKILHKRLRINAEISRRYEELGVDAKKILEVVNSVKKV